MGIYGDFIKHKQIRDAAPDLLAALEETFHAIKAACHYIEHAETRKFLLSTADQARAAIAKARAT